METKPLPTTVDTVEAMLNAHADFRSIPEHAQVHYLLGMCMEMLAQANREIEKLTLQRAQKRVGGSY